VGVQAATLPTVLKIDRAFRVRPVQSDLFTLLVVAQAAQAILLDFLAGLAAVALMLPLAAQELYLLVMLAALAMFLVLAAAVVVLVLRDQTLVVVKVVLAEMVLLRQSQVVQ
jgi:hypothetical protein